MTRNSQIDGILDKSFYNFLFKYLTTVITSPLTPLLIITDTFHQQNQKLSFVTRNFNF